MENENTNADPAALAFPGVDGVEGRGDADGVEGRGDADGVEGVRGVIVVILNLGVFAVCNSFMLRKSMDTERAVFESWRHNSRF